MSTNSQNNDSLPLNLVVSGNSSPVPSSLPPLNRDVKAEGNPLVTSQMERSLSSLASVLKRRVWIALSTFGSVITTSVLYFIFAPPMYEVTAQLMVDYRQVGVSELGRDISQLSSYSSREASPLATQAELIESERVLKRAVNQVFPQSTDNSDNPPTVKKIRKALNVKIIPATNILELKYEDQDPALATKLLNAIADAMVEENAEAIRLEAKSLREFLEVEVSKQIEVTEAVEAAESEYRQKSGLVSVEEQTQSLVENLASLENEESMLLAQLKERNTQVKELQQITGLNNLKNAYAAGRIGQDEELQNLRARLEELERELASARSRMTDKNPVVISLLAERNAIFALYNEKLARVSPLNETIPPAKVASDELSQNLISQFIIAEVNRLALADRLKEIQSERIKLQNRLEELPIKQQPLAELVRQKEEAIETLKLLQSKLAEVRIAEAKLFGNIQIIELAELPSSPSSLSGIVLLVLATFVGIILAIAMVLLVELMDNTLHDGSEVEEMFKLPKLGVLPNLPVTALSLEQPEKFLDDAALVEHYRLFLKTLEFITHGKSRLIVVSSSSFEEGKSIVVSHLAAVSAMLSRRTLIINADLHRPNQDKLLGVTPQPGLTDVINNDLTLLEAVQTTAIENLSILTCGEPTSRPSEFIESASMKSLLQEAAAHYDLVIVDTQPVSSCADAITLSRDSDGLVIVVRPDFTQKDILRRIISELKRNGTPVLGCVVNGMKEQSEQSYSYSIDAHKPLSKLKGSIHLEIPPNSSASARPWRSFLLRGTDNVEQ